MNNFRENSVTEIIFDLIKKIEKLTKEMTEMKSRVEKLENKGERKSEWPDYDKNFDGFRQREESNL